MRVAVFGDIGSDYEGLKQFFIDGKSQSIHHYVCLGDICSHKSLERRLQTNECIKLLEDYDVKSVFGNHDKKMMNIEYPWLNDKSLDYLSELPLNLTLEEIPEVEFAHKSPSGNGLYFPRMKEFSILKKTNPPKKICFFGHTHWMVHFAEIDGRIFTDYAFSLLRNMRQCKALDLSKGYHLINPGSIDPSRQLWYLGESASYAIYDTDTNECSFYRVK
jgi:predicted phosphodiesterase